MKKKKPPYYGELAAMASAVLYYALDLSAGDRHAIDWIVIGLLSCAIAYYLTRLGQRLFRLGGMRDLWHEQRTLLFWVLAIFNTALLRPEDADTWRRYAGWALFAIAVLDSIAIFRKERRLVARAAAG